MPIGSHPTRGILRTSGRISTAKIVSYAVPVASASRASGSELAASTEDLRPVVDPLKRACDLVLALVALCLALPVLGVVAAAILMIEGPPVFFRQVRVGLGGRDFVLLKFRTMTVSAGAGTGGFDAGDAARVTRLGGFLRRTKLDELPQLWNVVRGEMSLVGPRPEVREWVSAFPERWARVLTVRPGITDPASIEFRNEEDILAAASQPEAAYRDEVLPRKLDLYEQYVATHSSWGDIRILARTVWAVLKG